MKLLIITQKVDINDDNLGFFHRWLEKLASRFEKLSVICLAEGEHHLPSNVAVFSLGIMIQVVSQHPNGHKPNPGDERCLPLFLFSSRQYTRKFEFYL